VVSKPYTPHLSPGEPLAFELRANPVITGRSANGKAARHDVVMQEKTRLLKDRRLARWADWQTPDRPPLQELVQRTCSQWLLARCQRLGITIDIDTLGVDGYEQHRGKNGQLRFSTVDFSGRLRVVDAGALRVALFEGIGHAKAFGCGLLLVRRLG
jgi:CRISPR system Cascade subunit CasE